MEKQNYLQDWEKLFIEYRTYLISFGFRMTGSLTEAEDIVQDAFIACAETNPLDVKNPKAWLTKIVSNRSLDHLKSASAKRTEYVGVWLPDAIPDTFQIDSELLNRESLTTSFLLLLQKLSPEERVVYLLSDIFEYSFYEISEFLQKSEDSCKKIAQRARKAFENKTRFAYSKDTENLVVRFFERAKAGDANALDSMLAPGSEFWADGGGKVSVASGEVITDRNRITKFFSGLWSAPALNSPDVRQEYRVVNSLPGLVVSRRQENDEWKFDTIISFEFDGNQILRIFVQRNPDKLSALLTNH